MEILQKRSKRNKKFIEKELEKLKSNFDNEKLLCSNESANGLEEKIKRVNLQQEKGKELKNQKRFSFLDNIKKQNLKKHLEKQKFLVLKMKYK